MFSVLVLNLYDFVIVCPSLTCQSLHIIFFGNFTSKVKELFITLSNNHLHCLSVTKKIPSQKGLVMDSCIDGL